MEALPVPSQPPLESEPVSRSPIPLDTSTVEPSQLNEAPGRDARMSLPPAPGETVAAYTADPGAPGDLRAPSDPTSVSEPARPAGALLRTVRRLFRSQLSTDKSLPDPGEPSNALEIESRGSQTEEASRMRDARREQSPALPPHTSAAPSARSERDAAPVHYAEQTLRLSKGSLSRQRAGTDDKLPADRPAESLEPTPPAQGLPTIQREPERPVVDAAPELNEPPLVVNRHRVMRETADTEPSLTRQPSQEFQPSDTADAESVPPPARPRPAPEEQSSLASVADHEADVEPPVLDAPFAFEAAARLERDRTGPKSLQIRRSPQSVLRALGPDTATPPSARQVSWTPVFRASHLMPKRDPGSAAEPAKTASMGLAESAELSAQQQQQDVPQWTPDAQSPGPAIHRQIYPAAEESTQPELANEGGEAPQEANAPDSRELDKLARDVYDVLRRRLITERERSGVTLAWT